MLLKAKDIEQILKEKFNIQSVSAIDLKGGNHWQVNIKSSDFDGLSRVKREQLVQKALADLLQDETIHALVVKAKASNED
jgi:stress-induced morphogen